MRAKSVFSLEMISPFQAWNVDSFHPQPSQCPKPASSGKIETGHSAATFTTATSTPGRPTVR